MITKGSIYKVDLSLMPSNCAASNYPRVANGDIVIVITEDIFLKKYFKLLGVKCYDVKVVISAIPRASKDKGIIGKVPSCVLVPHRIDLSTDRNMIKASSMYKTKAL